MPRFLAVVLQWAGILVFSAGLFMQWPWLGVTALGAALFASGLAEVLPDEVD